MKIRMKRPQKQNRITCGVCYYNTIIVIPIRDRKHRVFGYGQLPRIDARALFLYLRARVVARWFPSVVINYLLSTSNSTTCVCGTYSSLFVCACRFGDYYQSSFSSPRTRACWSFIYLYARVFSYTGVTRINGILIVRLQLYLPIYVYAVHGCERLYNVRACTTRRQDSLEEEVGIYCYVALISADHSISIQRWDPSF